MKLHIRTKREMKEGKSYYSHHDLRFSDSEVRRQINLYEQKLHVRTKQETKEGKCYYNILLSDSDVRRQINLYEHGKSSAKTLAHDIMRVLFFEDFSPEEHWEISPAIVEEFQPLLSEKSLLEGIEAQGDEYLFFDGEKKAILDWKCVYAVATACARIVISPCHIFVDEYTYNISSRGG